MTRRHQLPHQGSSQNACWELKLCLLLHICSGFISYLYPSAHIHYKTAEVDSVCMWICLAVVEPNTVMPEHVEPWSSYTTLICFNYCESEADEVHTVQILIHDKCMISIKYSCWSLARPTKCFNGLHLVQLWETNKGSIMTFSVFRRSKSSKSWWWKSQPYLYWLY